MSDLKIVLYIFSCCVIFPQSKTSQNFNFSLQNLTKIHVRENRERGAVRSMMSHSYASFLLAVIAVAAGISVVHANLDPSWQDTEMTTRC